MDGNTNTKVNGNWLTALIVFAVLLTIRLVVIVIYDPEFFPINVLKITAPYQYLSREQIQNIIAPYSHKSFFVFSEKNLQEDFKKNPWVEKISIQKKWPDSVNVQILERFPVAIWDNMLVSDKGDLFRPEEFESFADKPHLVGQKYQVKELLHIFEKLSKLLIVQDLFIQEFRIRDNQSWEIVLSKGVIIRLGKHAQEERLNRFLRVYPKLFAMSFDHVSIIDLRYPDGIAVKWKKESDQIISNPKKDMG